MEWNPEFFVGHVRMIRIRYQSAISLIQMFLKRTGLP
jgi:hypothetical protein